MPPVVHVGHAGVDVVTAGTHVLEPERFERDRLWAPAGDGVHAHLGVDLPFELPHLRPVARLDDVRAGGLQRRREIGLEEVGWLHDVIVDRDHGVANLPRLGLRQEELRVERRHGRLKASISIAQASSAAQYTCLPRHDCQPQRIFLDNL